MKKLSLLLILVLLTGCSVDYNLTINENNEFDESIYIQAENDSESQSLFNDPWPIKALYSDLDSGEYPEELEGVEYYKSNLVLNNNYYLKKLSYKFNSENIYDNNSIKTCYESFYVNKDEKEKTISLSTSSKFLCMENYPSLNEVNIKINIANPVVTHNASKINGNTYEWNITRDNYENSGIIIKFKKEKEANEINRSKTPSPIIFIFLAVFFLILIGLIVYKTKNNK